jgi:uncharacterized oligopeptide transporter (OPT) family protein
VFIGFGIAAVYQFLWTGLKLWREVPERALSWFKGAVPAIEVNPALLGVGYIIGSKISCVMVAGGILSAFVLIPAIRLFGDGLNQKLFPGPELIVAMSNTEISHNYVLYIGAGAVAAGGIISLFQALPLILGSIRSAVRDFRGGNSGESKAAELPRTDRDLPLWFVGAGSVVLVLAIWATTPLHQLFHWIPQMEMNLWGALLIVLFGFLFVTVSSRLTGEIGSSSNPISGMTVATLLLTCLIFLVMKQLDPDGKFLAQDVRLTALSIAAVVCIAASNGGTTSQDLKTGYLVGATPKLQQLAIVVGSVTSAMVIGIILIVLNKTSTVYSPKDLPTLRQPLDVSQLSETEQAPNDNTVYHVWYAQEGNSELVPQGKYLVDDQGKLKYLVDPGINGKLHRRPDGTEVQKYDAPKARLMALITDGILNQKLEWTLVLLGVCIALVLEFCNVPSLPFAVGVYLPLSSSTPIFVGGLVRFAADRWRRKAEGTAYSEMDSDMSPGVLLSTGYIAGGAIAGVLIAFLSFNETIPKFLGVWQYRHAAVEKTESFQRLCEDLARKELHISPAPNEADDEKDLQSITKLMHDEIIRAAQKPKDYTPNADQLDRLYHDQKRLFHAAGVTDQDKEWHDRLNRTASIVAKAAEIRELNEDLLPQYVQVGKGAKLKLPDEQFHAVNQDKTLGEIAQKLLGSRDKAQELLGLNEDTLKLPNELPPGAELKVPQRQWPALVWFGGLVLLLVSVGMGWVLQTPAASAPEK